MKKIYILLILFLIAGNIQAQEKTIAFDSLCGEIIEKPDTYAQYALGRNELIKHLNSYSLIPITRKQTDYPITVKLLVCSTGKFTIVEIKSRNGYFKTLEVETERLIKLLGVFKPATKNGENVTSYTWLQLNYKPKKKITSVTYIIPVPTPTESE
jgi:hypothetical protein